MQRNSMLILSYTTHHTIFKFNVLRLLTFPALWLNCYIECMFVLTLCRSTLAQWESVWEWLSFLSVAVNGIVLLNTGTTANVGAGADDGAAHSDSVRGYRYIVCVMVTLHYFDDSWVRTDRRINIASHAFQLFMQLPYNTIFLLIYYNLPFAITVPRTCWC